ncbi:PEP-CTERM sorting domain-containing protein [Thiobacillus sp.]
MHIRLTTLAAALITCTTSTWAATADVDINGNMLTSLPTHDVFSQAGAVDLDTPPTPTLAEYQETFVSGNTVAISNAGYNASAAATLGSNHAYATYNGAVPRDFVIGGANWFDQVAITGGTGAGTATVTVQINGSASVGAYGGLFAYQLGTQSTHPYTPGTSIADAIFLLPSPYQDPFSISSVAEHTIEFLPYSNAAPTLSCGGIPPANPGASCSNAPLYDQTLGTGNHTIDLTLTGTINFTYGEAFYLIGGISTVTGGSLASFSVFGDPVPPPDGTGATTLDFSNSANLVNIALPKGATASFASGNAYNVTTVPEPGEWLMLLAGLGLVGWRARRRA